MRKRVQNPLGWLAIGLLSCAGLVVWYAVVYTIGLPLCWLWTIAAAVADCVYSALAEEYLMSALSSLNNLCNRRLVA